MTSKDPRLAIPQYLADELPESERQSFEAELAENPELRVEVAELRALWEDLGLLPEAEPSASLRAKFYQSLHGITRGRETAAKAEPKKSWWRFAVWPQLAGAAALFLAGLYFGHAGFTQQKHEEEVAQMRTQVQSLREMVALSLLDRQSAASRLQGVSWSSRVDRPDNELLSALLTALNQDPNVNVRLSSIDALEGHAQDASVRRALVDSIPKQESPLVQIALIDSLVHLRDRSAMSEFQRLAQAQDVNAAVRQRAHWALVRLKDEPQDNNPGK